MQSGRFLTALALLALASGCLPSPPAPTPQAESTTPATPPAAATTPPQASRFPALPGTEILNQDARPQPAMPPATAPAPTPPAEQAVRAQPGVAAQGRSLDNESGVLVTPAKALFTMREKAVFQIQIPQAISFFQGSEGRIPNSHDEFMTKIIAANNIQLPRLPPDRQYYYDPQLGELMVVRQRR